MAGTTFKFKFQRVLDLREQQQQALEGELAAVQEEINRAEVAVERWLRVRRDTLEEQSRARRNGKLGLDARYGDYLGFVRGKLTEAHKVVAAPYASREHIPKDLE